MKAITSPTHIPNQTAPAIIIHALKENKRPIGFAPWPKEAPKPKRTRKPKPMPSDA